MSVNKIKSILSEIYEKNKNINQGAPASYIPELARVETKAFALSVVTVTGEHYSVGDDKSPFTMQSTSKPFLYGLALQEKGVDFVHAKVGVEPTGEAFNSIIELEEKSHRPFNPMINSGAIATTSLIPGSNSANKIQNILRHFESYLGKSLTINQEVYLSEKATAHRNRAISYLMKYFNVLESDIEETLDVYFRQCSIQLTTLDLATMAATLANKGIQPYNQNQVLTKENVTRVLSLMFTCGMYDSAGEWAFNVGLPAKSGVSGAIFAVVPGVLGIAGYSPNVDEKGHSYRVSQSLKDFAQQAHLNIFN